MKRSKISSALKSFKFSFNLFTYLFRYLFYLFLKILPKAQALPSIDTSHPPSFGVSVEGVTAPSSSEGEASLSKQSLYFSHRLLIFASTLAWEISASSCCIFELISSPRLNCLEQFRTAEGWREAAKTRTFLTKAFAFSVTLTLL